MTFEKILTELKQKKYQPIYFLMGEESYFIDKITNYISENILDESEKDFNLHVMYGKDVDIEKIITFCRKYPMMSEKQVVIVKEAQNIKNIDLLDKYLENPMESTILVVNYKYKNIDSRKRVAKLSQEKGILFKSTKIYDNKIPDWISSFLGAKKIKINQKSTLLLAEYLGNDLSKISNELDKLMIALPSDEKQITAESIEKYIGISKEYNTFELQDALGKKDVLRVNKIINYFSKNPKSHPYVLTINSLFQFFSKLLCVYFVKNKSNKSEVASTLGVNPYFVKDYLSAAKLYSPKKIVEIISLLREYDLKSKGIGNTSVSESELLKELTFKILH